MRISKKLINVTALERSVHTLLPGLSETLVPPLRGFG